MLLLFQAADGTVPPSAPAPARLTGRVVRRYRSFDELEELRERLRTPVLETPVKKVSLIEAQNTLRQVLAEMNQPRAPMVMPAPRPKAIGVETKHDEEDDERAINAAVLLLMH